MKKMFAAVALALVALVVATPGPVLAGEEDKTAKGTVSAVGPDSVTIKADGQEMTVKVTAKTRIVARGGSTATRQAQQEGSAGPKLSDILQADDEVQVKYSDDGGTMTAQEVRVTKKAKK